MPIDVLLATFSKASGWCVKKSFFEFEIVKIIFFKSYHKKRESINECRRIIKIDDTTDFIAKLPDFVFGIDISVFFALNNEKSILIFFLLEEI
jgi:hypothetical protein